MSSRLVIADGDTEVEILPFGGAITRYVTCRGNSDYFWFAEQADGVACFPMVPFCSRIEAGQFEFAGNEVQLSPNNFPERHAIHGHGFQQDWRVSEQAATHVVLDYVHLAADWPWSYAATMTISLRGMRLRVTLDLLNQSDVEMPYGLGLHPYFPLTADAVVTAQVGARWQLDKALIGRGLGEVTDGLDPISGLQPAKKNIDIAFAQWTGLAQISWPEMASSLMLTAIAADTLVVYSPVDAEFVCVEPLSNAPNGLNLPDSLDGRFCILEPGASVRESWDFDPFIGD